MKHSSSNGCLFLHYSIPFPVLRGCPKSDILHEILELVLVEMTQGLTMSGLNFLPEDLTIIIIYLKEGYETLKQQ